MNPHTIKLAANLWKSQKGGRAGAFLRGITAAALLAVTLLFSVIEPAQAVCNATDTDQNCTNSTNISSAGTVVQDTNNLILDNTGAGSIQSTGNNGHAIDAANDATVTNVGSILGIATGGIGINAGHDARVTNTGLPGDIEGGAFAIKANNNVIIINSGSQIIATDPNSIAVSAGATATIISNATFISGDNIGIDANTVNVLSNTGAIQGANGDGIHAGTLTLNSTGTVTGGVNGIHTTGDATINASGTVSGTTGVGILIDGKGTVATTGPISGNGVAIQFNANGTAANDTLTIKPGTQITGIIKLGGGADKVILNASLNQPLTFDSLATTLVSGTVAFTVLGNQIFFFATMQQMSNAIGALATGTSIALNDFTRGVSSIIPVLDSESARTGKAASLAFAPENQSENRARINAAFASFPEPLAYNGDQIVFQNPTVVSADGRTVWARGFVGHRTQGVDGLLPRISDNFYGGALGGDFFAQPAMRVGAFIGSGVSNNDVALNTGSTDSDIVFGGLYGRYNFEKAFLHSVVQVGYTSNRTKRIIEGFDPANAKYDGWYLSPEITAGYHYSLGRALGGNYTLTPSIKIRYLLDAFDGYAETGSNQNSIVANHKSQNVEERGELKLSGFSPYALTSLLKTSISAGIIGVQNVGGKTIQTSSSGLELPVATLGRDNVIGGFGGFSFEWRERNLSIYTGGEAIAFSNSATVFSGRGGLRVMF